METIIIEKNKYQNKNYELLQWALKAKQIEESRYAINHICITKRRVICTDGHRLHMIRNKENWPIGLYDLVSKDKKSIVLKQTEETGYPDIKQVWPKRLDKKISFYRTDKDLGQSYTKLIRAMTPETGVNINLFDECITEGSWTLRFSDNSPIKCKNGEKWALIMPMRID